MRDQRGFTLIELMITVAIISVLALIAVPAFFSQSRKSKASSETSSMFAELSTKEEQYKIDKGTYYATSDSSTVNTYTCPTVASISSQLQSLSTSCTTSTPWTTLHINPPELKVYCSYAITVGPSGTAATPPAPFGMLSDGTTPTAANTITAWYYIVATCDMDGDSTKNSTYFMSSMDTRIQSKNPGY